MVIALALAQRSAQAVPLVRKVLVLVLVLAWGARLTYNWARNWRGLGHEDWRYVEYRRLRRRYWLVSLVGFHFLPTVWVYLGCLSLLPALVTGTHPLSILDGLAFTVTTGAIVLETVADEQLHGFRLASPAPGRIMDEGVWALCRHPNYLGEITFWWGLWLFAMAADPSFFWTVVGPVSITLMFVFVSTPLIDRRSAQRRPGYRAHMESVPALLPRLYGRRARRQVEP